MSYKQPIRKMPYTSFKWKFNPKQDVQIINEKEPIMAPPITNTNRVTNTESITTFLNAAHTHGKPNPIKHWRKQYSTTSPSVMGRPVPVKNNIAVIDTPGYTTISQNKGADTTDCADYNKCQSSPLAPDYMVAYRNKNAKDNVFGKGIKVDQRNPSGAIEYQRCVGICDPERAARRRTQYPSAVNTQVYTNENELCYNKSKYNQSNTEYMRSRCLTYNQNMTNQKSNLKPWEAEVSDCAYTGECGCKKQVIYKTNNYKFSQQGAVSNSSSIHRKKYNNIQRFASQFTKPGFLYGNATAAAYAYSSNSNTPFTVKDKTFTEAQCRTTFNACYKSKNINKTSYN